MKFVGIKGAEQNGIYQSATICVDLFDGISEDNPDAPKIGQCYAFEPILNGVYKVGGGFPDKADGFLQMTIRMGIELHQSWIWVNKYYQQDEGEITLTRYEDHAIGLIS